MLKALVLFLFVYLEISLSFANFEQVFELSKDAIVLSTQPTQNYGSVDELNVSGNLSLGISRIIIGLEQVNFPDNIIITTAILELGGVSHSLVNMQSPLELFETSDNWTENTVTWSSIPSIFNQIGSATLISHQQQNLEIDITEFLRTVLMNKSNGKSITLMFQDENQTYDILSFASSEHSDPGLRPKIRIEYRFNYPYAMLTDLPTSVYAKTYNGILSFTYKENYNINYLDYRIYNPAHEIVVDNQSIPITVIHGLNYIQMDLKATSLALDEIYLLEVINAKGRRLYLKFRYNLNYIIAEPASAGYPQYVRPGIPTYSEPPSSSMNQALKAQ